jgi:signal transduction histidine kinase/DNA-binding NarL/FixJ family response regulator
LFIALSAGSRLGARKGSGTGRGRSGIDPIALTVAAAIDLVDLARRLSGLLGNRSRPTAIRLWALDESRPRKVAEHPIASAAPDPEVENLVAVARSKKPARVGRSVAIPLLSGGRTVGVLEVGTTRLPTPARSAALSELVGARLHAALQLQDDGATPTSIRLDEVGGDAHAVVSTFAAQAKRLLDHDRLSVYLLTADGSGVERFAVATSPVIPGEHDVIPLEDVGLSRVLKRNRPLVSSDLGVDERIAGKEDRVIAAAGFHGLVSVPLRIDGRPIGVINFVSKTVGFYAEADLPVAQQIADQVAVFFQNLRLEQKIRLSIEREAIQHERDRLAHELHDTLAQSLGQMSLRLAGVTQRLGQVDPEAAAEILLLHDETSAMLDQLGSAVFRRIPLELEDASLADAIRSALDELDREHGIAGAVEVTTDSKALEELPAAVESTVFRIFQEAIANVRKHSGASRVAVTLRTERGLTMTVDDDGKGFVDGGTANSSGGFGLWNMRERAAAIGARVIVTSTPGSGTSVYFNLPSAAARVSTGKASSAGNGSVPVPKAAGMIRVLVVDDHPLFLSGLSELLAHEGEIRVVGQAATAQEALAAYKQLSPDVVLLDMELPDASGIDLVGSLLEVDAGALVLMLSAFAQIDHVISAMRAGARGYLAKAVDRQTLIDSIRTVVRGGTIFDSSSGAQLWQPRKFVELTPREVDVVKLVACGKTNSEIAKELCLAPKTIERILAVAATKLGARNRAHAVAKAVSQKLVDIRSV